MANLRARRIITQQTPELNPVENIWQYIRANWLSNRVVEDYDAIIDAGCEAGIRIFQRPETTKPNGIRTSAHVG